MVREFTPGRRERAWNPVSGRKKGPVLHRPFSRCGKSVLPRPGEGTEEADHQGDVGAHEEDGGQHRRRTPLFQWDAQPDQNAQIAAAVGSPRAVRAVGQANHRNPIPILIPCHRVVGADGTLTGYGGGLELKRKLLELEGAWT